MHFITQITTTRNIWGAVEIQISNTRWQKRWDLRLINGSPLKMLSVQKEDGVRDSNFVLTTGLFFFCPLLNNYENAWISVMLYKCDYSFYTAKYCFILPWFTHTLQRLWNKQLHLWLDTYFFFRLVGSFINHVVQT